MTRGIGTSGSEVDVSLVGPAATLVNVSVPLESAGVWLEESLITRVDLYCFLFPRIVAESVGLDVMLQVVQVMIT